MPATRSTPMSWVFAPPSIGDRFDDADLRAFGTLCQGQALIAAGETAAGVARLDEVMVSVTTGELGPITTGIVYCGVILACMELLRSAPGVRVDGGAQRLGATAQPGLVPFRGQCLVHRSQLQQAEGDWSAAVASAQGACRHLADPPHPALGLARYQEGEMHRLYGDFEHAERDYREASRHGYDPMPGLALLQLARGDGVGAAAMIDRALTGTRHLVGRGRRCWRPRWKCSEPRAIWRQHALLLTSWRRSRPARRRRFWRRWPLRPPGRC